MPRLLPLASGLIAALAATHAQAQTVAPPDPPFMLVPADHRLTLGRVFMDADPLMKLIMAGLLIAALAALVVWILGVARARSGGPGGRVGGLAYLSGLAAAAPLIGFFGFLYVLLNSALALSNVRPAPSISIMAPGWAEALLSAALGLLAAALGVIGHRHLQARLHTVAQDDVIADRASPAPAPRQLRTAS